MNAQTGQKNKREENMHLYILPSVCSCVELVKHFHCCPFTKSPVFLSSANLITCVLKIQTYHKGCRKQEEKKAMQNATNHIFVDNLERNIYKLNDQRGGENKYIMFKMYKQE